MISSFRRATAALAFAALCAGATAARAGDDGSAPIWEGLGSIVSPLFGLTDLGALVGLSKPEPKAQIEYREHGKLVVPKSMDLPSPGGAPVATEGNAAWPVNQEDVRRKARKDAENSKRYTHGTTDARNRQPFPNAPVTVRAADQEGPLPGACPDDSCKSTGAQVLGAINPLGWMGFNKTSGPPPEPTRQWLTDPPTGYRAPATGSAAN